MSTQLTRRAETEEAGQRLDSWLAGWSELSRSRIKNLILQGHVSMDGRIADNPSGKVREGAEYSISVPPPMEAEPAPENIQLDCIYEDDDLLVINKPAGMTVHPAPGNWSGTLVNALLHHCKGSLSGIGGVMRPGIVHRIDKDTTGLLVVAKHDKAHQGLSAQFADHSIKRSYICFVRGAPRLRAGRVETRIGRSSGDRKKMAVLKDPDAYTLMRMAERGQELPGKIAITNYECVRGYGQQKGASVGTPLVSKIRCRLETGRTHQIRVHMAHLGCSLLGDQVYGKAGGFKTATSEAETVLRVATAQLNRQALHAQSLGFIHPISGKELAFETDLPEDMIRLETALTAL